MSPAMLSALVGLGLVVFGIASAHQWLKGQARPVARSGRLVEEIADPNEAVVVLLVRMALEKGEVSLETRALIQDLVTSRFSVDAADAEGVYSFARAAAGRIGDLSLALKSLLRPIRNHCTFEQMNDLVAMMGMVSDQEGGRTPDQHHIIKQTQIILRLEDLPA